jgi:cysteinyl-tRNA synthetase
MTKFIYLLAASMVLLSQSCAAFVVPFGMPTGVTSGITKISPQQQMSRKLNDIDEMCIENVAELCLQVDEVLASTECDMEEYEALLNQLQDQKTLLQAHVERIDDLVHRLKADGLAKEQPPTTYFAG